LTKQKFDEFGGGKGSKGSKTKDISSLKDELDSLTRQTKMMESQLSGAARSVGKSKKVNFEDDDDDGMGEISTDKKYD
jgi:hypothetical protein